MATGGYKIRKTAGIHFVTFSVVGWVDVFTREDYRQIFLKNLQYCQEHKELQLHAWCLMSNHAHLIVSAANMDTSSILRDFKKFTAKAIIKAIATNPQESRREWMLAIFKRAGKKNSRNTHYQFWQQDNHPKELFSEVFSQQKLNYVHNNPVEAGIVANAAHYLYSSAKDYEEGRCVGLLSVVFLD